MESRQMTSVIAEMRRLHSEHASLVAGEIWHPIEARWAQHWLTHIGLSQTNANEEDCPAPGPLDNSRLQGHHKLTLSTAIQEQQDFVLIHDAVWNLIIKTYGGGPDFPREVVTSGVQLLPQIELHPLIIRVTLADSSTGEPDPQYVYEGLFSVKSFLSSVIESSTAFFYPENRDQPGGEEYRLWRSQPKESDGGSDCCAAASEWVLIEKSDLSMPLIKFELCPENVNEFLLEKKVNELWPRAVAERDWRNFRVGDVIDALDTSNKWYESTVRDVKAESVLIHYNNWDSKWDEWIPKNNTLRLAKKGTNTTGPYTRRSTGAGGNWSTSGDVVGTPIARGIVGLRNLGNTCFMNSTLQCLLQCPVITDFFLDDKYLTQLNRTNPLGWQGKVAETYAQLVKDYWSGDFRILSPRELKQVIGEFQPSFRGYQQQDSQELLIFLLDALHEDLNRIKDKPLTNAVESAGRPDAVVAEESWNVYKRRNDSILTDSMIFMVKSRLICPLCGSVGVKFDEYSTLPLALPVSNTVNIPIRIVYEKKAKKQSTVVNVTVDKSANIQQLIEELSKLCAIPTSEVVLCDVFRNNVYRIYKSTDAVDGIRSNDDTWAFHMKLQNSESVSNSSSSEGNPGFDSDEEGAIRSDIGAVVPVGRHIVVIVTNFIQSTSDAEQSKINPCLPPFPVELPAGVEIPAALVRDAIIEMASRFTAVEELGDFRILMVDKMSSEAYRPGLKGKELGQDLQYVSITSHTAFQLVWPSEIASKITQDEVEEESPVLNESTVEPILDLNQCLNFFVENETLSGDNAWSCETCRRKVEAIKRLDIWTVPQVLVILLKRFQHTGMWRNKITTMVDFPLTDLCLDDWSTNPLMKGRRYDLFAVSNHFGSLGGGHYTAYVKNLVDGKWYNMDDSMTSPIDPSQVVTEAAYVLFYTLKPTKT